jgi:hypothetical protein
MNKVFEVLGGRKNTLVLVVIFLLALNDFLALKLTDATINYLVTLAGIGVGGHALVDSVTAVANKKPKK